MKKKFWRIGVKYVELEIFDAGFPYVWGGGVVDSNYLDYLKDVNIGDIIVSGGVERIYRIGTVKAKPVYLFKAEEDRNWDYSSYGIEEASDQKLLESFQPFESEYNDIVCVETDWLDIDCSELRMPRQTYGGIRELNKPGRDYINSLVTGKMNQLGISFNTTSVSPLLTFTAIDFETGSGYRNSVCQVGLVRVVAGVIVEEYCGLIQPPNNYIRPDFSKIHGILPEQTQHAPTFKESYPTWKHLVQKQTLVAHNAQFERGCLTSCLHELCGTKADFKFYCTMKIWRGEFQNAQLSTCCENNDVELDNHHNALADARASAKLFMIAVKLGRDLREA